MKGNYIPANMDFAKRPICPRASKSPLYLVKTPSRFRRRKHFEGSTISIYNENFRTMPKT